MHYTLLKGQWFRGRMDVWQEIAKNAEIGAQRLVAEYGDRVFAAATLLCRDDGEAEDLVFRTFEQAVKKIHQYKPAGDFFGWLYKILLNFYRMEQRKNKPGLVLMGSSQDLPQIAAREFDRASVNAVRHAVNRLPPQIRETVVLKYFQGMPIEKIAECQSIPEGTVKSRLFTARRLLEKILTKNKQE